MRAKAPAAPSAPTERPTPGWRSVSTLVLAAAVSIALMVAGAFVWRMVQERQAAIDEQLEHNELYARVLEDHATRTVETASLLLASMAANIGDIDLAQAVEWRAETLSERLLGLPQLRSVAVLDAAGRVRASSNPRELGLVVETQRLGPLPRPGVESLSKPVPGRGLQDVLRGQPGAAPAGLHFVVLARGATGRQGEPLWVLALINPDNLASTMRLTIGADNGDAVLTHYDGTVIASTGHVASVGNLSALPVFKYYLPDKEHASYVGPGAAAADAVVSFRLSRSRPLVVVVERPLSAVLGEWWADARWRLLVGLVAAACIALLGLTASRGLRARELARQIMDRAQAEVARSERELSVIVRSVQELLFRTDADGVLTFVNARWSAASGLPAEELVGQTLADFAPMHERAALRSLFGAAEGAAVRTAQATFWVDGGRGRRFDIAAVPLMVGGRLVGFAGSAVDVTEQLEAQTRLQQELAFSAQLLEISPLPTSMLDTLGRYVSVNRAWEQFTGRTREQVVGRTARGYLPPEEARLHDAVDKALLAGGGSKRYEARMAHPDGSQRDLLIHKVVVPGREGKPAGVLVAFMDVSELREAERATREARDAAEEASRAKSEFIANISHELRTPLQSIIGFSELGMVRGRAHEKLAAMFGDIHASGQRMLALVNDLLDVSKLESSVGTFHLERTDLRPLVREVLHELEPLLTPKQLAIDLGLSDVPLVAKVDPMRFAQVVRNVLANAIKFSPPRSSIEVHGQHDEDGAIHFTVRDHGPGIPPDEQEKIFEAFVQSSKTKDGSGGTGLGLAICRKIVEAHGGRIHAANAPGGGSSFHIRLPSKGFAETTPMADDFA